MKVAQEEIQKTKAQLGQIPDEANQLIHFLNTRNKEQLEELGILERKETKSKWF